MLVSSIIIISNGVWGTGEGALTGLVRFIAGKDAERFRVVLTTVDILCAPATETRTKEH